VTNQISTKHFIGWLGAMILLELFDQLEQTFLGTVIRDSAWLFPVIESIHLLGLAILGGSILILDLRLLNILLTSIPINSINQNCRLWFRIGISVMIFTGIPLFISESIKCYYNPFFWIKMITLTTALIFTFTVRAKVIKNSDTYKNPIKVRATGVFSMLCWFTVAASGRWIGFY